MFEGGSVPQPRELVRVISNFHILDELEGLTFTGTDRD